MLYCGTPADPASNPLILTNWPAEGETIEAFRVEAIAESRSELMHGVVQPNQLATTTGDPRLHGFTLQLVAKHAASYMARDFETRVKHYKFAADEEQNQLLASMNAAFTAEDGWDVTTRGYDPVHKLVVFDAFLAQSRSGCRHETAEEDRL